MTWLETIEEAKNEIIALREINADLLEALKMLVADYEEIGGEAFYDDAYKQAKEEIHKAEEQMR